MPNQLYNLLGNNVLNFLPPPLNNMANLVNKLNSYRSTLQGNPEQMVQQKLNSGEISQQNLNQVMSLAKQIQQLMR